MPLGKKWGAIFFLIAWIFASHDWVATPDCRLSNSPILCTSRACRKVKGDVHHQATANQQDGRDEDRKAAPRVVAHPGLHHVEVDACVVMKTSVR